MNADGTNVRHLTRFSIDFPNDAKWSRDGSRIVFDANSGGTTNAFTSRPDGTDKAQLTHFKGVTAKAFVGAWSPDGKWIVWHRSGTGPLNQLFVMDTLGGHVRQLTHLPLGMNPLSPAWGAV